MNTLYKTTLLITMAVVLKAFRLITGFLVFRSIFQTFHVTTAIVMRRVVLYWKVWKIERNTRKPVINRNAFSKESTAETIERHSDRLITGFLVFRSIFQTFHVTTAIVMRRVVLYSVLYNYYRLLHSQILTDLPIHQVNKRKYV
jgi:hypothetical protein